FRRIGETPVGQAAGARVQALRNVSETILRTWRTHTANIGTATVSPTPIASTTKKSIFADMPAPTGKIGTLSDTGSTKNSSANAIGATSVGYAPGSIDAMIVSTAVAR